MPADLTTAALNARGRNVILFCPADESVISPHPVSMEEIGCARLLLAPEFQLDPFFCIVTLITSARTAGNQAPGSIKHRRCPRDRPTVHTGYTTLPIIAASDQFTLRAHSHRQVVRNFQPFF